MKRRALLSLVRVFALSVCLMAPARAQDGYPIANFAVTANVSTDGDLFGRVLQNRGKLGDWLTDLGGLRLTIKKDGKGYLPGSFPDRDVRRAFPFVTASLKGHPAIRSKLSYTVWAPLGLDDLETTTLPVLQLELSVTNPSDRPETLEFDWLPDTLGKSPSYLRDFSVFREPGLLPEEKTITVPARSTETLRYALVLYDTRGYAAIKFKSREEIEDYVLGNWDALKRATQDFEAQIPRTRDAELNDILRWYMVPGVALTKCTDKGIVVTLGYCELNQRDSYWASWLHLVTMPSAERKMIEESFLKMRDSGKIPTCIYPRIDRKDDIDINAFFILRCYRYVHFYKDLSILDGRWDELKKAADWLISRDLEDIGLPMQTSTWADWKDVSGVKGRKYSPYAAMVYAAAMDRMVAMAGMLGDKDSMERYRSAAERATRQINLPVEKGGLWNGRYYCQVWDDGRKDDRLLQDQTVGILFNVIPRSRARSIIRSLNRTNLTPYGICETFPYYPDSFGYAPATYHNGGVWPWLSFVDDWGRLKLGRKREAIDLVKRVAKADLEDSGDWAANEHINSLTGENLGFRLQGWNASLYGLVRFGLCQKEFQP